MINKITMKRKTWLPILVLVVTGSFIYLFNLNNSLFWDDDDWIINNNSVHSISWDNIKFWFSNNVLTGVGLQSNYYRPFLFFTFALNWIISGTGPFIYHLTSNAIHILNALLIFWLIRIIFKIDLLAFLTSLFFLIHPLQTEAITYISGRGDALVTMFMLLALLFFYKKETAKQSAVYSLWSVVFLVLGLLSRETGIIFPFLAIIFYVSFISLSTSSEQANKRFVASVKRGIIKTWPYFAVVIIYGVLRLTILNFQDTLNFYSEQNLYSENLHVRLFTLPPILWEYLKLLVVPIGLHMERSATIYTSLFQWPVWLIALTVLCIMYYVLRLYKNEKWADDKLMANGKWQTATPFRVWFFGVSWFFVALAPVSGITPINALIYEHWLYLPMVGFWLIISFYLLNLFDHLVTKKIRRWSLVVGLVVYFSFFFYQSIQRNILWSNPIEFYKDILKYEPDSVRINNNLGNQYFNQGDKKQAEFYYRKAAESEDSFAQPHFNIGSILQSRGDTKGAIVEFEKAIEIDPGFFYPYQNLAVIYAQQGDFVKAIINIEKLKLLIPDNPRVYYNSALVYLALNNKEKAVADLKEGLKYADTEPETEKLIGELIRQLTVK